MRETRLRAKFEWRIRAVRRDISISVCVCVRECVDPCLINQHLQIRTPRSLLVAH